MTAGPGLAPPSAPTGTGDRRHRSARVPIGRRLLVVSLVAIGWAVARAGLGDGVVNTGGASAFGRFWAAALRPEAGAEFVRLTIDAAAVTMAYTVLGMALALVVGAIGALGLSSLLWPRSRGRGLVGILLAGPRGLHEILWALFLIQILGFDPLVPVLAIGIPYGAISAKVFAEAIDEADPGPFRQLRAIGAGRIQALVYGTLPGLRGDLLAYLFYRLECGIRAAAVLGVIGAGGLGFQLDLSFETLRYHEIWTLIAAMMLLSGGGRGVVVGGAAFASGHDRSRSGPRPDRPTGHRPSIAAGADRRRPRRPGAAVVDTARNRPRAARLAPEPVAGPRPAGRPDLTPARAGRVERAHGRDDRHVGDVDPRPGGGRGGAAWPSARWRPPPIRRCGSGPSAMSSAGPRG